MAAFEFMATPLKGAQRRGARTAPIRGYRRPEACYPLKAREQAANDSSTRRVIADSRKTAQYFARLINGNVTIIVKNGFMLIAAIVPVIQWADEKAVQFMRDAAGYAAVAFQRRQRQAAADLGENEE